MNAENNSASLWVEKQIGVADCGMKRIMRCGENPCRDVAVLRLYIQIHPSIQQRQQI